MQRFHLAVSLCICMGVTAAVAQTGKRQLPQSMNQYERLSPEVKAKVNSTIASRGEDHVGMQGNQTTADESNDTKIVNILIAENFDKLTAGNENQPDATDISFSGPGQISENLTQVNGWGSMGAYQAGGCLYLQPVGGGLPTYIRTPYMDLSTNAGNSIISFRARSFNPEVEKTTITLSHGFIYDIPFEITNQWQEYSIRLGRGGVDTYVMFSTHGEPFLLDDIEVKQEVTDVGVPNPEWGGAAQGREFSATWSKISDAKSYTINLYSYDSNGNPSYMIENEPVTETTFTTSGLDPKKQYYWDVRAVSIYDGIISDYCDPQRVHYMEDSYSRPTGLNAINKTDDVFTAVWDNVYHAEGYFVNTTLEHTAQRAEPYYYILNTDFSGIDHGTFETPDHGNYVDYLDDVLPRVSWAAQMPIYAEGALGLDNTLSAYGYYGILSSPYIDFYPNDEGTITLSLRVKGTVPNATIYYRVNVPQADGSVIESYFDSATIPVTEDWSMQQVTLKMTNRENVTAEIRKNTFLQIWPNGTGVFWIDDLKLSQSLKKGDTILLPYGYDETRDTESTVSTADRKNGDTYFFNVTAWGYRNGKDDSIISPTSEDFYIDKASSGIDEIDNSVNTQPLKAEVAGNNLIVTHPANEYVTVYDMLGNIVATSSTEGTVSVIPLDQNGIFIVTAGSHTVKVIK